MTEVQIINKTLAQTYGKYIDGRPKWRVIWSDDEIEKRLVEKETFSGTIYIGMAAEMEVTKKYSYIRERWILEKLIFSPIPQIVDSERGHYEPYWVFQDKHGNYLKPLWRIVEILVNFAITKKVERKNVVISMNDEKREQDLEIRKFMDELKDEAPPFDGRLSPQAHEGVAFGGVKRYGSV